MNKDLLEIIKYSLWNTGDGYVDSYVFEEMKTHALLALPAKILQKLSMSEELYDTWHYIILKQISYNTQYKYVQEHLPITVPFVVLKGTAAAQYYPYPEYRTMGDIDIMTKREDFDIAYKELVDNGYRVIKVLEREISFKKNNIVVELHRRFASLNNIEYAQYLDDLIFENIKSSHYLTDLVNGLVLLEHIGQHLENGLGLRQIIDWMMFVDKCLPDKKWPEFKVLAEKTGLTNLAIVTTRMCELYLGLQRREWSKKADENLCEQLMNYVLACGNFGKKRVSDSDISQNVLAYASTPKLIFKLLQRQGLNNWKAAQRYKVLRPIAWLYQANRYIYRGIRRKRAISQIKEEYILAQRRNAMFNKLGVKTAAKGIVIYKNEKYIKE